MSELLSVRVAAVRALTPVVREFTLVAEHGRLPGFSAGSHVVVHMQARERKFRNAHSLLSDPADPGEYRIAVRLQDDSRGGSRFMHEQVGVGDRLQLSPPANLFSLHSLGRHHLLIAGGIGITPFMAQIAALSAAGASFELHYAFRGGLTDAYADELARRLGERLHCYDAHRDVFLDLPALLAGQALGTHAYVCGPPGLIAAVREQALSLGWPPGRVHWEAFEAPRPGEAFTARLAASGQDIAVAPDQSLLEALEDAGLDIPNLCRGGVCGQCATAYVAGDVEHRDSYLDPGQRSALLMPCVSRGRCDTPLVLDL